MNGNGGRVVHVPEHPNKLLCLLNEQRETDQHCDITIKVNDTEFTAHRTVLAACSNYFKRILVPQIQMADKVINMNNTLTPYAVEQVLQYIYSGQVQMSPSTVIDVLHAASTMQVSDLLQVIEAFLCEILIPKNCLKMRRLGRHYNLDKVASSAYACLVENFEEVSDQEDFRDIQPQDLQELMESDELVIQSEYVVYNALLRWVKKDVVQRKQYFPYFFKHVRLQLVEPDCLSEYIRKEVLVKEFSTCRDDLEDALCFHLNHDAEHVQTPRGKNPDQNAVAIFSLAPDVHLYDCRRERWTYKKNQCPGNNVAVTMRGDDVIVCQNDCVCQVNIYRDGQWAKETAMNRHRSGFQIFIYKDELYVIGGVYTTETEQEGKKDMVVAFDPTMECYNFESKKWRTVGRLQTPRTDLALAIHEESMFLLGGSTHVASQNGVCCLVESYNMVTKKWTTGPNMNSGRALCDAVCFNSSIYVFGGIGVDQQRTPSCGEVLDIATNVWSNLTSPVPMALGNTSACLLNNMLVVLGGSHLLTYDPYTSTWRVACQVLPAVRGGKLAALKWPHEDVL